jgi:hypothetical protein
VINARRRQQDEDAKDNVWDSMVCLSLSIPLLITPIFEITDPSDIAHDAYSEQEERDVDSIGIASSESWVQGNRYSLSAKGM